MLVLSFPTRSTANPGRTSSYASITKLNRDPLIEQPRPNLSLLETNPLLSPTSETQHLTPSNHIQGQFTPPLSSIGKNKNSDVVFSIPLFYFLMIVVSAEEALKIRESIENPLETPPSQFLSAPTLETPPPPSTPPTNEIKVDKKTIDAIARVEKAEQKIKEKLDKTENLIDSEGKRLKEGAKKGIKEVRKEVKKRDDHARKVVRTYPGAVVGLMGLGSFPPPPPPPLPELSH